MLVKAKINGSKSYKFFCLCKFAVLFITFSCVTNLSVYASPQTPQEIPDDAEEGIYQLTYSVLKTNITALFYKDSTYLPLNQILLMLKIFYEYDGNTKTLDGFFIKKDSTFNVNFTSKTARFNDNRIFFSDEEFVVTDLENYVLPSLFQRIFPIRVSIDNSYLVIRLESRFTLPILAEYYRKKKLWQWDSDEELFEIPLLFDRNRSFLNGGLMDYSITGIQAYSSSDKRTSRNYQYKFDLGLEVMGGDALLSTSGNYSELTKTFNGLNHYFWRYFISDNPFLTQVAVGSNLSTVSNRLSTVPQYQYEGIQITNELTWLKSFFKATRYDGMTTPGWDVELYLNGVFYDHIVADSSGYYYFDIPLRYGGLDIQTRFYGIRGEYESKSSYKNITYDFLPAGRIRYTLNAGKSPLFKKNMAHGTLSIGFTDWLSNTAALQKKEADSAFHFYNSISLRLFDQVITHFNYFSGKLLSADLAFTSREYGYSFVRYTKYTGRSELNYANDKSRIEVSLSLPKLIDLPYSISVSGYQTENPSYTNTSFFTRLSFALQKVNFFVGYNYNFIKNFESTNSKRNYYTLDAFWQLPNVVKMSILQTAFLRANTDYDAISKKFGNLNVSLQLNLYRIIRFTAGWQTNLQSKRSTFYANVMLTFPTVRTNTNVRFYSGGYQLNQDIMGGIGYDSYNQQLNFRNNNITSIQGSGAASLRFFVDENDNGIMDENEEQIQGVYARIGGGRTEYNPESQASNIYNLTAYRKVQVNVNMESFKNPLLVPKYQDFTFVADPNVFKPLNIPCYVSGVIEGNVYRVTKTGLKGQGSIRLRILSNDGNYDQVIPVFTDGSFYQMGIPPGEYKLYLDSLQMSLLNVTPNVPFLEFKVNKTTEGDYISNLNFELKPNFEEDKKPLKESGKIEPPKPDVKDTAKTQVPPQKQVPVTPTTTVVPNEIKSFTYQNVNAVTVPREMIPYLDAVIEYLKTHPTARVSVVGHTETFGTMQQAQILSERRANEVVNYMTTRGIPSGRILARGQGALNPIESNLTPAGRAKNRRVEIQVID